MWPTRFLNKALPFPLGFPDFFRAEVQMVQCRILEGAVMSIVVANHRTAMFVGALLELL